MAIRNRNPDRLPLIPRPPAPKNSIEFIVEVFVVTVATLMLGSLIGVFLLATFRPGSDYGALINAITDIMTTIIGALIGYIAGKGARQIEIEDQAANLKKEEKDGLQ